MEIIKPVFIILEVVVLFNLLIFVHELGHFLAAKWRGLKIERFAIWFGKPIWMKKINGVEYALGTIPAGGYVSLPQMAPMEMIEGKSESTGEPLPPISPLDKIIVAFAGPLFSFLLAFVFACLVWAVGKPEQASKNSTTVGWVVPDGPAGKAGLKPGDKIIEVDGYPVTQFSPPAQDSVTWRIVTSEGSDIPFKFVRDGKEMTIRIIPTKLPTKWYERKSLRKILIDGAQPAVVGDVATNGPAALAGLREGDVVVKFNGEKVLSPHAIMHAEDLLTNGPIKSASFTVRRDGKEFDVELTPVKPVQPADSTPSYGVLTWLLNRDEILAHPRPLDQVRDSAGQIYATFKTLLSPKSDVGVQQLGGAVMILRVYKNFLESENGWRRVLWFSVVLNVNLALLNLLPFPVLDGGHITLAMLEAIRRRPVSIKLLSAVQTSCALLLIGFMLFITFYDAGDWFRSARENRAQPVVFAPKQ